MIDFRPLGESWSFARRLAWLRNTSCVFFFFFLFFWCVCVCVCEMWKVSLFLFNHTNISFPASSLLHTLTLQLHVRCAALSNLAVKQEKTLSRFQEMSHVQTWDQWRADASSANISVLWVKVKPISLSVCVCGHACFCRWPGPPLR